MRISALVEIRRLCGLSATTRQRLPSLAISTIEKPCADVPVNLDGGGDNLCRDLVCGMFFQHAGIGARTAAGADAPEMTVCCANVAELESPSEARSTQKTSAVRRRPVGRRMENVE